MIKRGCGGAARVRPPVGNSPPVYVPGTPARVARLPGPAGAERPPGPAGSQRFVPDSRWWWSRCSLGPRRTAPGAFHSRRLRARTLAASEDWSW